MHKPVFFVSLFSSCLAACGQPNDRRLDIDAKNDPIVDAAKNLDSDTSPDAPPASGLVTMVGNPGDTVVFQRADQSVVAIRMIDDSQQVSQDMPRGGSVTKLFGVQSVVTYLAVKPGDRLENRRSAQPQTNRTFFMPDMGGEYNVRTTCGSLIGIVTSSPQIPLDTSCTAFDIFANSKTKSLYLKNISTGAPGTVISLAASTAIPFRPATLSITNPPPQSQFLTMNATLSDGIKLAFESDSFSKFGALPNPVSGPIKLPDVSPAQLSVETRIETSTSQFRVLDVVATATSTVNYGLNWSEVQGPILTSPPVRDTAGTTLSWTEDGVGNAEAMQVSFTGVRGGTFVRTVFAPHLEPALHLPVLPAPLDIYNLLPSDQVTARVQLIHQPSGYDGIRNRVRLAAGERRTVSVFPITFGGL
jgi:hypothetical protein